jgi:2-keto-4-pentenoate hydratase
MMTRALFACLVACGCVGAHAACLDDSTVADFVEKYTTRTPVPAPEGLSDADAACSRAKLHSLLVLRLGPVIGYKAGLTNAAVQKRFNTDKPVWGRLYEGMVLADGAVVDAAFGARPLFEADMLVRISSDAINAAQTPQEVLDAIDQVIPFIELPDLMVQTPQRLDGAGLAAINVAARLGVAGQPIGIPAMRADRHAMLNALRDMKIRVTDDKGAALAEGRGSDLLGHPLQAVVWLAGALAAEGLKLKPGDLVSLGSFSPLLPPRSGSGILVTYEGLPGKVSVGMSFR